MTPTGDGGLETVMYCWQQRRWRKNPNHPVSGHGRFGGMDFNLSIDLHAPAWLVVVVFELART
jgi:hypothetical protein